MAERTALVSIIIPCLNAARWLGDAIESCLAQTWEDREIIVVDNGSTDDSVAVAKSYEADAITVLECPRKGASAARNFGFAATRGAFIQFLDADDVLARNKIRSQMVRLISAPPLSVASGAWGRFHHHINEARFLPEPVWCDLGPEEFLITSWLGGGMMAAFSWLVPRVVIERAGPWNEHLTLNDDGEFFSRAVLASSGILFCDGARGYYRTSTLPSLSSRRDADALHSLFNSLEYSCVALIERCKSERAKRACAQQYHRFLYQAYPDVPDLLRAAEARIAELGGSDLPFPAGPGGRRLARWFGWKTAKRIQLLWRRANSARYRGTPI